MFRLYDGAVKSAQIVEFLKALRTQLKRKLLIVWNGAAQHKRRIAASRSSLPAGSKPSCGDVMAYVKLNSTRSTMTPA